jgi:hypothetical protein
MSLTDELASEAARTLVAAAAGNAWEAARRGFARIMGRGNSTRTELAEHRLDETRQQLRDELRDELRDGSERQDALITTWRTRLADLLEEDPDIADDLRALLGDLSADISATGHGVAAGRDVNVTASGGGVAAAVIHGNVTPTIHGNVTPANPTAPGPAMS